MNALVQLTENGRVPGTPLRNKKWEIIAQETVAGKTCEESGAAAGIKPGPGRKGNVARIRQYPIVRERIGEISARSAELAEIHDGWILARCSLLARSAVSRFFRRDPVTGEVMQNKHGFPMFDFQRASEDELQMLKAISFSKNGVRVEVHSPEGYLDKLGKYRGLWSGDAVAVANAGVTVVISQSDANL